MISSSLTVFKHGSLSLFEKALLYLSNSLKYVLNGLSVHSPLPGIQVGLLLRDLIVSVLTDVPPHICQH